MRNSTATQRALPDTTLEQARHIGDVRLKHGLVPLVEGLRHARAVSQQQAHGLQH
nr:hypothetical protein [Pseudoxanthomonas sp.]